MGCASLEKSVACWVHNVTQSFIQEVLITDLICQFAPCWIMFPALQPFRVEIGLIYFNLNVNDPIFLKAKGNVHNHSENRDIFSQSQ